MRPQEIQAQVWSMAGGVPERATTEYCVQAVPHGLKVIQFSLLFFV